MKIRTLVVAAAIACAPLAAQAEITGIGKHTNIVKNINTPQRGSTMKSVLKRYGQAHRTSSSTGQVTSKKPRITRWEYPGFTVYFEKRHVLHTVVHPR